VGDKLAVPSQDGVRAGDIGHLAENLAAQSMTDLAERGSLGGPRASTALQLRLQDAIFGRPDIQSRPAALHLCESNKINLDTLVQRMRCPRVARGWRWLRFFITSCKIALIDPHEV